MAGSPKDFDCPHCGYLFEIVTVKLSFFSKPAMLLVCVRCGLRRQMVKMNTPFVWLNLARTIRDAGPQSEMIGAVRELIDSVVVERTQPGEPIRVRVNGRLAALIGAPVFPESSLSGVKLLEPPTPEL